MKLLWLFFMISMAASVAEARVLREDIGELKIHDLLLRPTFALREPTDGSFTIGESSFALRWELEQKYGGVIRIGPRTLLNPTARYTPTVNSDIVLVEAFAEYTDAYGRFRLGRIPIEFGWEGKQWERDLIFPRSLLYQNRVMMLRDVGGSYIVEHNNFYTGFAVHNGESDSDQDGRIWYTAQWGFHDENFEIGLSGQTGGTKPVATNTSGDDLAGVDPSREARWRIGGLHAAVMRRKWQWSFEYFMGEREQETDIGKFASGHLDMGYHFSKTFSTHLRWDQLDPNFKVTGDLQRQGSLALVLSNNTHSSNLILVGTKVLEEKHQTGNDEIRLIWSLSPSGVVRF